MALLATTRGSANRGGGTSNITVSSFTSASGSLMIASVLNSSGDPDSLTGHDGGSSWIKIATNRVTANGGTLSLWGSHSNGSTGTLVVADSTDASMGVQVQEITGADVSGTVANSLEDTQGNSGYGSTASTPALSPAATMTMGFFGTRGGGAITTGNTQLDNDSFQYGNMVMATDFNATGDSTHTASLPGGTYWAAIAATIKEASAADTGWNVEVRDKEVVTAVVRDSSTQITITLTAAADYDITAQDVITATIPSEALVTGSSAIVASPTFTVDIDSGGDNLLANDIESASEVTSPSISQEHALTANNIEANSEVSSPNLVNVAGTDDLLANDIQSNSEVSAPQIGQEHSLAANNVESDSDVSSTAIGQEHSLTAVSVEANSQVESISIGQSHILLVDNVESSSEVSTPTLTETFGTDVLTAVSIESASETTEPAIGQIHLLLSVSVSSNSEVTTSTIGQIHNLLPNNVQSNSEVSSPTLVEVGPIADNLLAVSVEAASEVGSPVMAQVHILFPVSIESNSEVSAGTLISGPPSNFGTISKISTGANGTESTIDGLESVSSSNIVENLSAISKINDKTNGAECLIDGLDTVSSSNITKECFGTSKINNTPNGASAIIDGLDTVTASNL